MKIKKADIYFTGENAELRISIRLIHENMDDNFIDISKVVMKHGDRYKLESIYFREEETK